MHEPPRTSASPRGAAVVVAVAAVAIAVLLAGRITGYTDPDLTRLMAFGEEATEITAYAEDQLGQPVDVRITQGHDGKFFFLQALDPLYLSADEHWRLLDRPLYRGQRMLYPLLAGGGGLFGARALPWTMLIVNLLAFAVGTYGTARLAQSHRASPLWGLAFILNLGLLAEMAISGGGTLAFACAIWAVVAFERGDDIRTAAWLVGAVLAREAMLLFVGGLAAHRWLKTRRIPWMLGLSPTVAVGLWALYLRLRIDAPAAVDEIQEIGWPLGGVIGAWPFWMENPFDLAVGVFLLAMLAVFSIRTLRSRDPLAWGSLGFVVLAMLLTRQVWLRSFDITRAVAPVLTAFVLVTFAWPRVRSGGQRRA